jgi:hypothetical protein
VTLARSEARSESARYEFYSLGYFFNEEDALGFSDQWARDWIDTRG